MERIRSLSLYQKLLLLIMALMSIVFAVIYRVTIAKEGFEYNNAILVLVQQDGKNVYSGRIKGEPASFVVYADDKVEFKYGDKTYGPYILKEDPTAVPKDNEMGEYMTGVELTCGEEIVFRGGVLNKGEHRWLYNEDGGLYDIGFLSMMSNGVLVDENGNVIDTIKPSASTILDLIYGPELTHKGLWTAWLAGVFICFVTAITILYADELFRWNLSFQIRNSDEAEPSDWEISKRYLAWTLMPVVALGLFIAGLQ